MSVSLITTTAGSADTAVAGATKINANYQGQWDEDRLIQVAAVEPGTPNVLAPGATLNIANITGGPGNVEFIQLAMIVGTGSPTSVTDEENCYLNATIKLTIDGTALTPIPLSIFYLVYGTNPSGSPSPTATAWWSDDIAMMFMSSTNPVSFGSFRRIFIPFNTSCRVDVVSGSTGYTCQLYTQVQYRLGAIPLRLTGTRRVRFQLQLTPLQTLTQFSQLQLLNVTGKGQIDSVQLFMLGASLTPTWLEGDPFFTLDGNANQTWGGTEDFFGTQYYGSGAVGAVMSSWGMPVNRKIFSSNWCNGMYRIFSKDPVIFNNSAILTIQNGQSGEGAAPPSISVAALVIYYLNM